MRQMVLLSALDEFGHPCVGAVLDLPRLLLSNDVFTAGRRPFWPILHARLLCTWFEGMGTGCLTSPEQRRSGPVCLSTSLTACSEHTLLSVDQRPLCFAARFRNDTVSLRH
ncbi:unnamed protein product [Symbiodinium natans]|uniref:Uncharacterized protein n=1 Tax=Symbiodinium natans TaxID=878477 RepID=A0A812NB68_9DINO|nr:unnamed protein product [Symbiodinium natans]